MKKIILATFVIAIALLGGFRSANAITFTGTEVYLDITFAGVISGISDYVPTNYFQGMEFPLSSGGGVHSFGCSGVCIVDGKFDIGTIVNGGNRPINWVVGWNSNGSSCTAVYDVSFDCEFYSLLNIDVNGFWTWIGTSDITPTTHLISATPQSGTTVSTSTDVGYELYVSSNDFVNEMTVDITLSQPAYLPCANSGAVYDAVFGCTGENLPSMPFTISISPQTLLSGYNSFLASTTFPSGGKWNAKYEIKKPAWWGLYYNTIYASTTDFIVGYPSYMDQVMTDIASTSIAQGNANKAGIGAMLASTTAEMRLVCNPIKFTEFDLGNCLTLIVVPTSLDDSMLILKNMPPWGYVYRMYDILVNTTATSTTVLPAISYDFASSSPMSAVGNIHFDPFQMIQDSGTLIAEMKSDRSDSKTVWQIFSPLINAFIYIVLGFMIIHDLTGIHARNKNNNKKS